MAGFIPSIAINTLLLAGSTAVNLILFTACGKDVHQLEEIQKAKLIAIPILITMSIILGSFTIGLIISKFSSVFIVSPTIDFLFVTSFLYGSFSTVVSIATAISISFEKLQELVL